MKIGTFLAKVILALVVIAGVNSCTKPVGPTVATGDIDYYTCTMHPWVHSKKPGTCPVCAMDLVPVYKSKSQGDQANQSGNAGAILSSSSKPSDNRHHTSLTCQSSVSNSSVSPMLKRSENDSYAACGRSVW